MFSPLGLNKRTPIILVGNKCDTAPNREVETAEAQTESSQRSCAFMEVSAKDNVHVTEAFMELLAMILPGNLHNPRKKKAKPAKQIKGFRSEDNVDSGDGGRSEGGAGGAGGGFITTNKQDKNFESKKKSKQSNGRTESKNCVENEADQNYAKPTKTKGKSCILS